MDGEIKIPTVAQAVTVKLGEALWMLKGQVPMRELAIRKVCLLMNLKREPIPDFSTWSDEEVLDKMIELTLWGNCPMG